MPAPELWLIAGPNGAGKTTTVNLPAFRNLLTPCEFINPDAVTLAHLKALGYASWKQTPSAVLQQTFIRAASECEALLYEKLEDGGAVAVETVLSTRKYCPVVERVRELGGEVYLIYVALNSPALSASRVAHRYERGGHDVPLEKLEPRWRASLDLLPWFAVHSSGFWILDNSESKLGEPGRLLVSGSKGEVRLHGLPPEPSRPMISAFIKSFSALDLDKRWTLEIEDNYSPPS